MKKLIKNEICGYVNSTRIYCLYKTGPKLRLLLHEQQPLVGKSREKKKKKKKGKRRNAQQQKRKRYPNITLVPVWFAFEGPKCAFSNPKLKTRVWFFSNVRYKKVHFRAQRIPTFRHSSNCKTYKRVFSKQEYYHCGFLFFLNCPQFFMLLYSAMLRHLVFFCFFFCAASSSSLLYFFFFLIYILHI